jgi:hypothetical protein
MIRPLTFLCLAAAFGSGLYLYSEKHKAIMLDREIGRTIHGTEAARERTGMLRAEWALLNDPGRLQDMSDKYLALKPMAPAQFVQLAELSTRLPAVPPPPAPGPGGGTDDPTADDTASAAPDAAAVPAAVAPPPEPPAVVAKIDPPHAAAVKTAPRQVAHLTPRKPAHPAAMAERDAPLHDSPLARGTPLPLAGLPQAGARVMSAMARPMRLASARPAMVTAYPSALGSTPYVGSALASGNSLPPPVPLR